MGISLKIKTPRYNFSTTLSHKMNVVIGDSGKGKTTLLNLLTGNSSNVSIDISEGYDIEILNESVFKRIIKKIERFYKMNGTELPGRRTPEDSKQRDKMLIDYWKSSTNFDFFDSVIFIDDEDFVRGNDFACMFNSDTSNCYVVFSRGKLSQIGVHMDAIYNFETTGVDHFLVPSLDYEEFHVRPTFHVWKGNIKYDLM